MATHIHIFRNRDGTRRKCVACGKPLSPNPYIVEQGGRAVYVGSNCFKQIKQGKLPGFKVFPRTDDYKLLDKRHAQARSRE